jgi:hypothetical protein
MGLGASKQALWIRRTLEINWTLEIMIKWTLEIKWTLDHDQGGR